MGGWLLCPHMVTTLKNLLLWNQKADRQSAKFQKMLRNHFRGDQMLMKETTVHSVQWSMPVNFQGGDN